MDFVFLHCSLWTTEYGRLVHVNPNVKEGVTALERVIAIERFPHLHSTYIEVVYPVAVTRPAVTFKSRVVSWVLDPDAPILLMRL